MPSRAWAERIGVRERIPVAFHCFHGGGDVRPTARDLPQRERRQMVALSRRRWTCFHLTQSQPVFRRNSDQNRARRLSRKRQSGSRASSACPADRHSRRRRLTRRPLMRARLKAKGTATIKSAFLCLACLSLSSCAGGRTVGERITSVGV